MELFTNPYVVVTRDTPTYTAASGDVKEIPNLRAGVKGVAIGVDEGGDVIVLLDTQRAEAISVWDLDAIFDPSRIQMWRDCLFLSVGDVDDAIEAYWQHLGALLARARESGKVCARCRAVKPLGSFSMDATRRDGYAMRCRKCERERQAGLRALAAREQ